MGTEYSTRMSTSVDEFVGNKLRLIRREARMSQTELGGRVGISFQQIQKYEKGSNRIGASRLWEFCQIFRVEPSFFFLGLEETLTRSDNKIETITADLKLKNRRLAG